MKDLQGRRWQITINNNREKDLQKEDVIVMLQKITTIYFCLAEEIGKDGTLHMHLYIVTKGGLRFSTLQKMFDGQAHLERVIKGTSQDNRDYIAKEGIWVESEKAKTKIEGSFYEEGELPDDSKVKTERDEEMLQILEEFGEGKTVLDVIKNHPRTALRGRDLAQLQKRCLCEFSINNKRDIEVEYIYGNDTEAMLDLVYKEHDYKDVCRIVNYHVGKQMSFDIYDYQPVIAFCNFRGQIPIKEMCDYCSCYPVSLPSRFEDKIACYTKVYILSDVPPAELYVSVSTSEKASKAIFLKKLDIIVAVSEDGSVLETKLKKENLENGKEEGTY